jgi:hypothetical protein
MTEGGKPEKQRLPRWDSYPLPGKYATPAHPRWDAGVRRWPEYILLGISFALWVGLVVALGYSNGSLVAGAAVVSYPAALILLPMRRRLVPRELDTGSSSVPCACGCSAGSSSLVAYLRTRSSFASRSSRAAPWTTSSSWHCFLDSSRGAAHASGGHQLGSNGVIGHGRKVVSRRRTVMVRRREQRP